jgi:exopolysaccharide biosynthesis polyprenyl glycosylphosphotransferase
VTPLTDSGNAAVGHADVSTSASAPDARASQTRRKAPWRTKGSAAQVLLVVDLVCLSAPVIWERDHYRAFLAAALLSCALFWAADLYRPRLQAFVLNETPALLCCLLTSTAVVAVLGSLRHPNVGVSTYLVGALWAIGLTMVGRTISNLVIRRTRRSRLIQHRTIIVGTGTLADRMNAILSSDPQYGLHVVGYVADEPAVNEGSEEGLDCDQSYLGQIPVLRSAIDTVGATVVLISDRGFTESELASIVRQALWNDCAIFMVPRLYELSHQDWHLDMIGSIPVVRFGRSGRDGIQWKCKRLFDIVVSSLALLILSPLLALCALAVRLDSGPGIIFRQTRVGSDGRPFELIKFRSLQPADEQESSTTWSIRDDERVTRVGRFMRRTSLDELPQLWVILRGDMTIVGPRPERPHFVEKFSAEEPTYLLRHRVPAGLTGLAQVNGMRGNTSIAERSYFDNYYIDHWSLWLDAKVILRTFSEVLFGSGG